MTLKETKIQGLVVLEPKVFSDKRGYFMETFHQDYFKENVSNTVFIQDNESKSTKGVLRGLHFQLPPFEQAKLVRVIQGEVLDVAVDLRRNSSTYGQYQSIVLNEENKLQFFIPRGFAHGFVVLSDTAIFSYKVDNKYAHTYYSGIRWDDETLNVDWRINSFLVQRSDKDQGLSSFKDFSSPF